MKLRIIQLIVLPIAFVYISCTPDKCGDVKCKNEGVCVLGTCSCPYAFEGEFCEETWSDKFSGVWSVNDSVAGGSAVLTYRLEVTNGRTLDTLMMLGFADSIDTIFAVREAYDIYTIQERALSDSVTIIQGGTGTYSFDSETVTGVYSFKKEEQITNVVFTWSR